MSTGLSFPPHVHAKYNFKGKTIIITGGAGNIGRATALRFAKEGANVVIFDLAFVKERIIEVVGEINEHGGVGFGVTCDVTNYESVKEAVAKAIEQFTYIDYLFNNAGYQGLFLKTDHYPTEDFRKVMDINVTGVFNVLSEVSKHMRDTGRGGSIVMTSSMAGVSPPPNMIAYGASKAAVINMTQIAAKDLAPLNIRVNAISPAFIGPGFMWVRQTELQAAANSQYYHLDPIIVAQQMISAVPMRRYGSLDEVANVVAFLLSDDASYLTAVNIEITGGIC